MRCLLTAILALSLAIPCRAADKIKPNTLISEEIAEGWILLFDGETTFGWDAAAKAGVERGTLVHGGDRDVRASTTTAFRFYTLIFQYRIEKTAKDAASVTLLPSKDPKISLPLYDGWANGAVTVEVNGIFASTSFAKPGQLGGKGTEFRRESSADMHQSPQRISFGVPKGSRLWLRNVKLKPHQLKPLFNGKDLTGWKEFPDRKSKCSVTKEGWLSITNGPGDLQTTGQWADFMLQLECKTNGDNLNSGVFFRCQPGKYQQGYEAQIQNQHAKSPKTYTIDVYDPQTHKPKDKQKVENWSQDYGTGAIYRRIPARRAVARDREWFTMTVAAHGRHIATWVNGIQVVDWTDNRPDSDNGRNGCRLEKGPISLQGHDPTTDLSFRNIRIADLSEMKKN